MQTSDGEQIETTLVFDLIVQLCLGTGQDAVDKLLMFTVDDQWRFAINGKREPVNIPDEPNLMGYNGLGCGECVVWYNGFTAGLIDPNGGVLAAGECANEGTFIAALKACAAKRGVELKGGIDG